MKSPADAIADLAASYDREAEKLEAAVPRLEARRLGTLLVSQRVVDKLAADVAASDAERTRFVQEQFPVVDGLKPAPSAEALAAAFKVREVALVELFSDRVLDFAEEAKNTGVAAASRAKVLRETAAQLRAAAEGSVLAPASPEGTPDDLDTGVAPSELGAAPAGEDGGSLA